MIDADIKNFLNAHSIRIINDSKRAHRHTRFNTALFQFPEDYNKFLLEETVRFETEKLYTVEIAESELERIARFEAEVFNHMNERGHYGIFDSIMQQKEEERYLKNKYPAVKKAYEHYSLMLKLAKSGEL
jgi:hypothetical protein